MTVWLELRGPGSDRPKAAKAAAWTDPHYQGIDPANLPEGTWIGMRLDNHIVVDCDNEEAMEAWRAHLGYGVGDEWDTWTRKTPHGWHFIYKRTPATYGLSTGTAQLKGIHPKIDFKVGYGHQIVFWGEGYETVGGTGEPHTAPFKPEWIPEGADKATPAVDDWSEMPDGIGDNAMIAFAGTFRRWGMDEQTIGACLHAINVITMAENPMPMRSTRRIAHSAMRWDPEAPQEVMCPKCGSDIEVR